MVASGSWAPASGCDNQVERKGGKEGESNREYSSKVLASKELHYICMGINERGSICGLTAECQNKRGIANPVEDYASGSLRLAACRRE